MARSAQTAEDPKASIKFCATWIKMSSGWSKP